MTSSPFKKITMVPIWQINGNGGKRQIWSPTRSLAIIEVRGEGSLGKAITVV